MAKFGAFDQSILLLVDIEAQLPQCQEIKSLLQKAKEREQGAMKAIEKALNLH